MALHTNVGLGDFVLMDEISMAPFLKNLQIRYIPICYFFCVSHISKEVSMYFVTGLKIFSLDNFFRTLLVYGHDRPSPYDTLCFVPMDHFGS